MVLQQLLKAITKGWKTILVITLLAVAISLYISITSIPQYRAQATFIIAPDKDLASSRDIVSAFTALDTLNIFSTYTDILISDRVYDEARKAGGLADVDLANYSRQTEMNPESIILILTVEGPDAQVAASLANEIGKYGIKFINAYYSVFEIDFLDLAIPPRTPFRPQTFRDAGIFAGFGLLVGLLFVTIREFSRTSLGYFMHKLMLDNESLAYSKRHLEKLLLGLKAKNTAWPIAIILIKLKGLEDLFTILPGYSRRKILTEAVRRLKEQLKGNDLVGRWDELTFAVVLSKTPKKVVGMLADRLVESLRSPIAFGVDDVDQADPNPIAVSDVSENTADFDTFIVKAEGSLLDKEW